MSTRFGLRRQLVRAMAFGLLAICTGALLKSVPAQAEDCHDTPEGRVCSVQQPLVNGAMVPNDLQKSLGLVAVGPGCSGTLLNRYWVLTADHCVTSDGMVGGAEAVPSSLQITAAWSPEAPNATRFVRFGVGPDARDVALIFLGNGDFGPVNAQLFFVGNVEKDMVLTKYGRGIFAYATGSGPTAMQAQFDGQYRSARFVASQGSSAGYTLPVNDQAQVGNGGDSGAPDIVTASNGIGLGIAGVQSTCVPTGYVAGQAVNWNWATGVSSCFSAGIESIRFDILQTIQEKPGQFIGSFATTPPNYRPIFLYAIANNGDLMWYRQETNSSSWSGPLPVGNGWQNFRDVIPAGGNSVYALTRDGLLKWYRHDGFNDGTKAWSGPVEVGHGWTFKKIFSGGDGIVYAIRSDGALIWYRHNGFADGGGLETWLAPRPVGTGWGDFKDVFSAGQGIIYAVQPDGVLRWYRHDGYANGDSTWSGQRNVGTGWANFRKIIPVGDGILLALKGDGEALWYKHTDYLTGTSGAGELVSDSGGDLAGQAAAGATVSGTPHWEGPVPIGNFQGYLTMFALMPATPVGPR